MSDLAVLMGGPSPEHDVSILTGLQAARELARDGRRGVRAVYWTKTGDWFEVDAGLEAEAFVDGVPRGAAPLRLALGPDGGFVPEGGRFGRPKPLALDAAVVCCHGGPGEDGTLQAALDLAGITYTGPSVAGAALGMDKLAFAGVIHAAGLPLLPRAMLHHGTEKLDFSGPYIVKPRFGGSSIGIEVASDFATAGALLDGNPHLRLGAVVEPYRADLFDLQLGVRLWPEPESSAVERPLRSGEATGASAAGSAGATPEILGYSDKYVGGEGMAGAPRELPARVPDALAEELRSAAVEVARRCLVRGLARVDFLSDGQSLWVNEINTIPGSLARYLWIDPPLTFGQLLEDMVAEATARPSRAYSAAGADGSVLRSASSIAAKLA